MVERLEMVEIGDEIDIGMVEIGNEGKDGN